MADALETRSIALIFDLEEISDAIRRAPGEIWRDTLGSDAFYRELKRKVETAVINDFQRQDLSVVEYNATRSDAMADRVKNIAASHAASAAQTALENVALREDGLDLQGRLDDIQEYFKNSKAGIWLDESEWRGVVLINILRIGGASAVYSFRENRGVRKAINLLADVDHTAHIGMLRMDGRISDIDLNGKTGRLDVTAQVPYRSVAFKGKARGLFNYEDRRFSEYQFDGSVVVPISSNLTVEGGGTMNSFRSAGDAMGARRNSSSQHVKVEYSMKGNNLLLSCELRRSDSDKSVNCSAEVKLGN